MSGIQSGIGGRVKAGTTLRCPLVTACWCIPAQHHWFRPPMWPMSFIQAVEYVILSVKHDAMHKRDAVVHSSCHSCMRWPLSGLRCMACCTCLRSSASSYHASWQDTPGPRCSSMVGSWGYTTSPHRLQAHTAINAAVKHDMCADAHKRHSTWACKHHEQGRLHARF